MAHPPGETKPCDVVILHPDRPVNLRSIARLEDALAEQLRHARYKVVVDFEGVNRMPSTGIGVLSEMVGLFRREGGDLKVCTLSYELSQVFDMLALDEVLNVYSTQEEALRAFKP